MCDTEDFGLYVSCFLFPALHFSPVFHWPSMGHPQLQSLKGTLILKSVLKLIWVSYWHSPSRVFLPLLWVAHRCSPSGVSLPCCGSPMTLVPRRYHLHHGLPPFKGVSPPVSSAVYLHHPLPLCVSSHMFRRVCLSHFLSHVFLARWGCSFFINMSELGCVLLPWKTAVLAPDGLLTQVSELTGSHLWLLEDSSCLLPT